MSLKTRIIQGIFWSLAGNALSKLLNFFAMVLVARVFGPNDFGIFDLLKSSLVTFGVFSGMGIGLTATKYIASYYRDDKEKTGNILGTIYLASTITTFFIVALIFIFSKEFAAIFLNDVSLEYILKLGLLLLITNTFFTLNNAILAGFEAFKEITKINFYIGILNVPTLYLLAHYYGLEGVIGGMIVTGFLQVFYGFYEINKIRNAHNIAIIFKNFTKYFLFLWKFAFPTFIATFMVTPTILIAKAIIAHSPNGYEALGIYSAAFTIQSILILFSVTLNNALVPILVSEEKKENPFMQLLNIYISWIAGLIIAIPIMLMPTITSIIYGQEYFTAEYISTLKILLFAFIIYMFKESIRRALIVKTKMWFSVLDNFFWGVTLLLATYYFVSYGSVGLAIAYLLAYFLSLILMLPILNRAKLIEIKLLFSKEALFLWFFSFALLYTSFYIQSLLSQAVAIVVFYTILALFILNIKKMAQKRYLV